MKHSADRRGRVLPALLACLFAVFAARADALVPLASDAPAPASVRLIRALPHETVFDVSLDALTTDVREIDGDAFAVLGFPGHAQPSAVGVPALPLVRLLVQVPRGAEVAVGIEPRGTRHVVLADLGLPSRVVPVRAPHLKRPDAPAPPLVVDEAIYEGSAVWPPAPARVASRGVVGGRAVALVELSPVRYVPSTGSVEVWSSARVVVRSHGGDPCADTNRPSDLDAAYPTPPRCTAPEARDDSSFSTDASSTPAEGMIVIVHDDFEAAIDPLVQWKRRSGFRVEVVRTSELGASPTDDDVKAKIQNAYDTWTDPSLGHALLVGDTDFTPIHWGDGGGNSQVTDNWYACLDGPDYLPDIGVARISTRTAAETEAVVDKLLTYQKATFASDAWTRRAGFIGTSDAGHIDLIEGTHDWCIETHYTPNDFETTPWSHGGSSCDRHYHTYDADTSEIAASIDAGRTMVNYSGHGSETSWQGPTSHGGYDQNDVRANTNDGMYPLVISNACITGRLARTECFGETWQKEANKGAIAFVGASNNSYWDEDDYYQRRWHDRIFDAEPLRLGAVHNQAKIDLYEHYGDTGTMRYYFDMYNLLSEPSLWLWTAHPRALDVEYDEQIPVGATEMTVTVSRGGVPVEGDLVAVRKADEGILASSYTDASGTATLGLDPSPMIPGAMDVTVTGPNDRPHLGATEVIPMDGPWLRYAEHAVDDALSGCDADGFADIGETAAFVVTIENIGGDAALGARARLDSSSDVAVIGNPVPLGDLPSGGTAEARFDVRIGADVACLENGSFEVTLECDGCDPRSDVFTEELEKDRNDEVDGESFDHGGAEPEGWSHHALQGHDDWRVVDGDSHSGAWSFKSDGLGVQKDVVLVSDALRPQGRASLSFWHRYDLTETKSGAFVEISVEGSGVWADLEPWIVEHPYDASFQLGNETKEAWSGTSPGWVRTEIDLDAYAGETVRVRFRLAGLDGTGEGWWVDDVELRSAFVSCDASACGVPGSLEIVDVYREAGETVLVWWDDPVAERYVVYRSTDPSASGSFDDVTALDDDDTDATFRDPAEDPLDCWVVQGIGPDGAGPTDHDVP
jgi:hypothetical protein